MSEITDTDRINELESMAEPFPRRDWRVEVHLPFGVWIDSVNGHHEKPMTLREAIDSRIAARRHREGKA